MSDLQMLQDVHAIGQELTALRASNAEAITQIADLSRQLGEMQGTYDACQNVSVVMGWKERAEKAEAEVERLRGMLNAWVAWHERATDVDDDDLEYLNGEGWPDALLLNERSRAALAAIKTMMGEVR